MGYKNLYIALALLIISCGQGPKTKKEPKVEAQGAIEIIETEAGALPNNVPMGFDEIIAQTKTKQLPHIETTNFDSFIEDYPDGIEVKVLKLNHIYENFDDKQHYHKAISLYQLPLNTNFHTLVITVKHGDHEMETVLVNYDTDGNIIDHQSVAFDEIAESMARTVSRISENKLTTHRIFWDNDKEVQEIELEITGDGKIEHVDTKKLNDSFENFALIDGVLTNLKLDWVQTKTNLITTKKPPGNPNETILVIPEIVDEGIHYFNLNSHIVIADNRSGKIKNNYFESHETNQWVSDAIELDGIQIDPTPYKLAEDKTAFGVTVSHFGHSRVNPYSNKTLSLFVKSGDSLLKVLSDYSIEDYGGEWNGDCEGEFVDTKRTMAVGTEKTNGYFDIPVAREVTYSNNVKDKNGECLTNEKIENKELVLKFNGWRYSEFDSETILYSEFHPQKLENIQIDKMHLEHAHQLGDFKIVAGFYEPVNGQNVAPDTENDWGDRLLMLNASNKIVFKSQGVGDVYRFEPHFYKSTASQKTIIICQMAFEYPFGGEVFILEGEKIKHIGTLDIEGYDPEQNGNKYITEIVEIKEGTNGIEFSFKSDKLVLKPGTEDEVITNNNVRYVYKNGELSLLWNN